MWTVHSMQAAALSFEECIEKHDMHYYCIIVIWAPFQKVFKCKP